MPPAAISKLDGISPPPVTVTPSAAAGCDAMAIQI
jgi:hypothetical protein